VFLGRYDHTIDEKGRVTIPSRFRELLENGAYLTRGFDKNLMVIPAPAFEQMFLRITALSITDPAARLLRRMVFTPAARIEFDRAGRILSSTRHDHTPGQPLDIPEDFSALTCGERACNVTDVNGKPHLTGCQVSAGYREYKVSDGYANDLLCQVFVPI